MIFVACLFPFYIAAAMLTNSAAILTDLLATCFDLTALTAHLLMPGGHPGDAFLHDMAHLLEYEHDIGHVTLQVEALDTGCVLMDESVV